jgi:serine/threonine-protein kinase ULK/ATG1
MADFGFSKDICAPNCKMFYNVGSPLYMCPQSLKENTYSFKSDIWSIGVLFFEILFGDTPWNASSEKDLYYKMMENPVKFPENG